jgi:hypothetical protein
MESNSVRARHVGIQIRTVPNGPAECQVERFETACGLRHRSQSQNTDIHVIVARPCSTALRAGPTGSCLGAEPLVPGSRGCASSRGPDLFCSKWRRDQINRPVERCSDAANRPALQQLCSQCAIVSCLYPCCHPTFSRRSPYLGLHAPSV